MVHYRVFGGVLCSEIDFPELASADPARADWTLIRRRAAAPLVSAALLGTESLPGGVSVRLERAGTTFRLHFDDTGTFDVSAGGAAIAWTSAPDATPELARSDLLGRVLSLAFHASGDVCLHASAVAVEGRGIVVVGEKGQGKSTLAMALVGVGGVLLADDTVRLTMSPVRIARGVPGLRLRTDSARQLGLDPDRLPRAVGEKVVVGVPAAHEAQQEWFPVAAVYVLASRPDAIGEAPVERRRLAATEATLALVRYGKAAALLGREEAGVVLARAAVLAACTPVFILDMARDLSIVGDVARRLAGWHGAAGGA